MQDHLKPVEFIHAIEGASLGTQAAAHLKRCALCRETLWDVQDSLRMLQRRDAPEIPSDDAFWNGFTHAVHQAIRQRACRSGGLWWARAASLVVVLSGVILFLIIRRNPQEYNAPEVRHVQPTASQAALGEPAAASDAPDSAIEFEMPDAEQYLSTESGFYDRLQQDLSRLRLSPETLTDGESD